MAHVACVYVGKTPILLSADHGPFYSGDNKPVTDLLLLPGQTLMMAEEEVNGMTYWHDPHSVLPSLKMGVGRVVKAEHQSLTWEELQAIGYEYHTGREDFVTVAQAQQPALNAKTKEAVPATPEPSLPITTPTPVLALPVASAWGTPSLSAVSVSTQPETSQNDETTGEDK